MNHYFDPGDGDWTPRTITVTLAGRETQLETAAGTFSSEHLDSGTKILLDTVPAPAGPLLDIGCGWGPLALSAAMLEPAIDVWAIDINKRALELTRRNAERLELERVHVCEPEHVPDNVLFATMWSNPPIRVGKAELHAILSEWLPRLLPGGNAWLVVAKKLGAESLLKWLTQQWPTAEVSKAETSGGFWVLHFRAAD